MMKEGMLKKERSQWDAQERRKSPRVAMRIPVLVYSADTGNITSLYFCENVSKEGMFILSTRNAFSSGDKVYMEFAVPLKIVSRKIRLIGSVVRKVEGEEQGYGIKFEKMFEKDYGFLKSYLTCLKE